MMHPPHTSQYTFENRNMHISALNGLLRVMGQVHGAICEIGEI